MGVRAIGASPSPSVVIDDFDVLCAVRAFRPFKANAPLLVDPDAVLALPVTRQGFEAVARKLRQVAQAGCRFKEPEPLFGLAAEPFERGDPLSCGQTFGPLVFETPDHNCS
jgi:hypothetical protein